MAETAPAPADDRRASVLADYRKVLLQHKEADAKVRSSECQSPPAQQLVGIGGLREGAGPDVCAALVWQCARR